MDLFEKAEKARDVSQFETARKLYRSLLQKQGLNDIDKAAALLGLADVERIRGFFVEALLHYKQAYRLYQKFDPTAAVDAQVGWALSARASGDPHAALKELSKALRFYQHSKDKNGEAFVRWALGGTWRIAGDMRKGLSELQKALGLFKKLKNAEGYAYTCCALGGSHRMLGEYGKSGRYYREANRRMRQRKDTFGIAYSYCGLGNVERMAGRSIKALPFYKKAEKLYGTIGDRVSYAYTLWSLGTTYKMLGQYTQANSAFYKADNLFKKTGDTRGRIYALLGFAEVEFLKGNRSQGMKWWKQAKTIGDKSDYAWENLHVDALKDGKVRDLRIRYRKAGSRFYPTTLPINWP